MNKKIFLEKNSKNIISVDNNILNKGEDILPFGLFQPSCHNLIWICGYAEDDKTIISVFRNIDSNGEEDKKIDVLENLGQAKFYRDELLGAGWKKLIPPKIEIRINK